MHRWLYAAVNNDFDLKRFASKVSLATYGLNRSGLFGIFFVSSVLIVARYKDAIHADKIPYVMSIGGD